ncbi:MAG TPA: peptide deformylase [Candidatus Ventrousia excrementavium]|uniref:Peptide deformylase n=1 Tax=Candidatus Ventrousia excrementavium TaxID=2840961 RepID=A0A9D1S108_9CLOT|nr:peptide deformylase [Candidatus Ventrousia excrementavium]
MPTRNIVKEGDQCLRKICRPVTDFNSRLHDLLDDMHETLAQANGAGLAAPQVGVLRRLALVMLDDGSYLEIINPEIIERKGTQSDVEGCLSIPGVWGIVERPMTVTVRAQDRFGNEFTRKAEGFTARAFCHEIDHLDGHLFTDFVTEYIDPEELE